MTEANFPPDAEIERIARRMHSERIPRLETILGFPVFYRPRERTQWTMRPIDPFTGDQGHSSERTSDTPAEFTFNYGALVKIVISWQNGDDQPPKWFRYPESQPERIRQARLLTTAQLAAATAGGDDYIRTKNSIVKGLALRLDINPGAPDVVVVGTGSRIQSRAELMLESQAVVPAYIKRRINGWEFLGTYRATAYGTDEETIDSYLGTRPRADVAGILFLEEVNRVKVEVEGGGFADPLTRKEVEQAAIAYVTRTFEGQGYIVHDRQRENCGYDLLAVRAKGTVKIEVKGTDWPVPRFFLTRNERATSQDEADWRLAVVCSARLRPKMTVYTASEAEAVFSFDPLAWECIPRTPDA